MQTCSRMEVLWTDPLDVLLVMRNKRVPTNETFNDGAENAGVFKIIHGDFRPAYAGVAKPHSSTPPNVILQDACLPLSLVEPQLPMSLLPGSISVLPPTSTEN